MIKVDNKVKNIYYMLCYSFYGEQLNKKDEKSLGEEVFDNIYNLFSLLLCLILKRQIKKGIYKDYNHHEEELNRIRGKIDINATINQNSIIKRKIVCNYDEYDENCLLNKVIKTTIFYLIKSNKIGSETKQSLKSLSNYFKNVDIIEIKQIKWDMLRFNRNNISYKFVVDLCKLILNGLIVSDRQGSNKFKEFLDDTRISTIYENFIKAYYRKHYPELNAHSRRISLTESNMQNIPIMKTDITLEYSGKTLIIDAKFYNKILKENYYDSSCKTISNNHLNQIFVYVDSQDPYKEGKVSGMLLYAQTIDEPSYSFDIKMIGHKIFIRTLDMNEEWDKIRIKLNTIAESFKNTIY